MLKHLKPSDLVKNRFVLGIVVVFALQFCFQGFNALERADERYFQVKATTPLLQAVGDANAAPEIASLDDEDQFIESAPATVRAVTRRPVGLPTVQVASLRMERKPQPLFPTVRITYPVKPLLSAASEPQKTNAVARVERRETRVERREVKERSLVARALPIVKKPLDFFKFVGSKLR